MKRNRVQLCRPATCFCTFSCNTAVCVSYSPVACPAPQAEHVNTLYFCVSCHAHNKQRAVGPLTAMQCCLSGTDCSFNLRHCDVVQALSCRPPTGVARVRSSASPCGICGERSDTRIGFCPIALASPVSKIPLILYDHLHPLLLLPAGQPGEFGEPSRRNAPSETEKDWF